MITRLRRRGCERGRVNIVGCCNTTWFAASLCWLSSSRRRCFQNNSTTNTFACSHKLANGLVRINLFIFLVF